MPHGGTPQPSVTDFANPLRCVALSTRSAVVSSSKCKNPRSPATLALWLRAPRPVVGRLVATVL